MNGLYYQQRVSSSGMAWTGLLYTQLTLVYRGGVGVAILIEIVVGLTITFIDPVLLKLSWKSIKAMLH